MLAVLLTRKCSLEGAPVAGAIMVIVRMRPELSEVGSGASVILSEPMS